MDFTKAEIVKSLIFGTLAFILSWQFPLAVPGAIGLDPSWAAGLYMASHDGISFGSDFVFTYGPIGYLANPYLFFLDIARIAVFFDGLIAWALMVSIVLVSQRRLTVVFSAIIVMMTVPFINIPDQAVMLTVFWAIIALVHVRNETLKRGIFITLMAFGTFYLLVRPNTGITICVFVAVVAIFSSQRRLWASIVQGATFTVTLIFWWLLFGQSLLDLYPYIVYGLQIVSGFSEAMFVTVPEMQWLATLAVLASIVFIFCAYKMFDFTSNRIRIAILLGLAFVVFATFKHGFVRINPMIFFPVLAVLAFCTTLKPSSGRSPSPSYMVTAFSTIVIALFAASSGDSPKNPFVLSYVKSSWNGLILLFNSKENNKKIETAKAEMRAAHQIDSKMLSKLEQSDVYIAPWEETSAWAYNLKWNPTPVIQWYSAYTAGLDNLNAKYLASKKAPEQILWEDIWQNHRSIDERYLGFDSPATIVSMLCNYRPTYQVVQRFVLKKVDKRCGKPRMVGAQESQTGEWIEIPKLRDSRHLLTAKIEGIQVSGLERIRNFLFHAYKRTISIDSDENQFRLVPGTAINGLLLRAPGAIDLPGVHSLAPNSNKIKFQIEGGSQKQLRLRFFETKITTGDKLIVGGG